MDLDSIPPRASLVHPADVVSQGPDRSGRASVLLRPLPVINPTASGNSSDNVKTNATSAQQLYATGKTSQFASTSLPTVRSTGNSSVQTNGTTTTSAQRLYATKTSQSTSTSLPTVRSIVDGDATPVNTSPPLTQSSSPPPPPTSVESEHFQPRYPSGRLREKSHPFLSLPLSEGSTGQALYNAAVQTSTSVPNFKPRGPTAIRNPSVGTSYTKGHDFPRKALPPTPADRERRNSFIITSPTVSDYNQPTNLYAGITEDNILLMPSHGSILSTEQRAVLIDEVPLSPISRTQSGFHQPSPSFTRSTDHAILQPRPIKPLQGLTASFQDQIRETAQPGPPSLEEEQHKNAVSRTTKRLFRRFTSAGPRKPNSTR